MGETPVQRPATVLLVIAVSAFLATFNETFLNVALTPIMQDFSISSATVQWVSTAYMLVAAVTVPVTSFLYRSVPTRRLSIIAACLLLAGTVLGAAATTFPLLIVARIVQAMGTGMIVPIGMDLTLLVAPQGKLGSYMGVVSAVTLLGPAFGPIAGGGLLSIASWHFLFLVFAVLVVIALCLTIAFMGDFAPLSHPNLDAPSVALVAVGLMGIMYGVSTAFSGNPFIAGASSVVGIACMAIFVLRQRGLDTPLLDLRPFGIASFNVSLAVVFVAFMAVFAMNIILPLFMQGALGYTAMDAALTLLAPCMLCCIFAPIAGRLFDRFGLAYTLPAALAVMAIFMFSLSRLGVSSNTLLIIAFYTPILIGCSFSVGPAQSFALGRLAPELHAHGVTACYTVIQIAGCIGSSFYVGIMSASETNALNGGVDAAVANATGFSTACLAAAAFAVVGFCFALATSILSRKEAKGGRPAALGMQLSLDDVMAKDVYKIGEASSAYDALLAMVEHKTSGLPIVKADGSIAGFVSDGDIMRALSDESSDSLGMAYYYALWMRRSTLHESLEKLKGVRVLDVATKNVISVESTMGLDVVCRALSDASIKKIPITKSGELIGSISRSDLLRLLICTAQ
ncbi:MAG: MFS transporter [Eggerthellaceae bacterium]|nr:MFS transporter [Eggerthellaceae bacterium]